MSLMSNITCEIIEYMRGRLAYKISYQHRDVILFETSAENTTPEKDRRCCLLIYDNANLNDGVISYTIDLSIQVAHHDVILAITQPKFLNNLRCIYPTDDAKLLSLSIFVYRRFYGVDLIQYYNGDKITSSARYFTFNIDNEEYSISEYVVKHIKYHTISEYRSTDDYLLTREIISGVEYLCIYGPGNLCKRCIIPLDKFIIDEINDNINKVTTAFTNAAIGEVCFKDNSIVIHVQSSIGSPAIYIDARYLFDIIKDNERNISIDCTVSTDNKMVPVSATITLNNKGFLLYINRNIVEGDIVMSISDNNLHDKIKKAVMSCLF